MAHYLLRTENHGDYYITEADSARQAVAQFITSSGDTVEVWTLRTGEPRIYEVSTETVRTIKQT